MSDIYREFQVDVLRDSENAGPTAAEMNMAQEIKRLRAEVKEQARLLGVSAALEVKLRNRIELLEWAMVNTPQAM
jgi:transposase-like protein